MIALEVRLVEPYCWDGRVQRARVTESKWMSLTRPSKKSTKRRANEVYMYTREEKKGESDEVNERIYDEKNSSITFSSFQIKDREREASLKNGRWRDIIIFVPLLPSSIIVSIQMNDNFFQVLKIRINCEMENKISTSSDPAFLIMVHVNSLSEIASCIFWHRVKDHISKFNRYVYRRRSESRYCTICKSIGQANDDPYTS